MAVSLVPGVSSGWNIAPTPTPTNGLGYSSLASDFKSPTTTWGTSNSQLGTTPTNNGFFEDLYKTTLGQTASDYDSIMKQYQNYGNTLKNTSPTPVIFNPISATNVQTSLDPSAANAMSMFQNFYNTGGYSDADLANLRARAISPIRSVYANAQSNIDRQRALQGGYSPNYTAATTKMARDLSEELAGASTNVNAEIAKMVQEGKLAGASGYSPLAQQQAGIKANASQANASAANSVAQFNANAAMQAQLANAAQQQQMLDNLYKSIQGQQSLYGTTPALANTFGNQVLNATAQTASLPSAPASSSGGFGIGNIGASVANPKTATTMPVKSPTSGVAVPPGSLNPIYNNPIFYSPAAGTY